MTAKIGNIQGEWAVWQVDSGHIRVICEAVGDWGSIF